MYEVYRDMYDALGVRDAERIMKRVPDEEPMPKDPAQENIDTDMIELRALKVRTIKRISWLTGFWNVSDGSGFTCCSDGAAKACYGACSH